MKTTPRKSLDSRKLSELITKHFAETSTEEIWDNLQSLGLTEASNFAIEQFKSTLVDLIIYCKQNGRDVFDVKDAFGLKEKGFPLENGGSSPYIIHLCVDFVPFYGVTAIHRRALLPSKGVK